MHQACDCLREGLLVGASVVRTITCNHLTGLTRLFTCPKALNSQPAFEALLAAPYVCINALNNTPTAAGAAFDYQLLKSYCLLIHFETNEQLM